MPDQTPPAHDLIDRLDKLRLADLEDLTPAERRRLGDLLHHWLMLAPGEQRCRPR